ncbi:MAG TPA: glycosyltransferase family 1 protein, partial [Candidatus Competibacter sp.]|nr:glycosyltransferase family 1 protein [Candidatus Competibacter sp.]
ARGLPIVGTTAGAIPGTVPAAAGLLVPPGDEAALAGALARVLTDLELRQQLAAGARAVRSNLPGWPSACARFAATLHEVLAQ